eukprot:582338-Hanusia_phi.AAC.1
MDSAGLGRRARPPVRRGGRTLGPAARRGDSPPVALRPMSRTGPGLRPESSGPGAAARARRRQSDPRLGPGPVSSLWLSHTESGPGRAMTDRTVRAH